MKEKGKQRLVLTAHQPAYLPWLGYFDKIIQSDVFVFMDDVQFEKNSFTNRNRIKTSTGECMLSVPVKLKGHIDKVISEIEIDNSQKWRKKHLQTIYMNYKRADLFTEKFGKLEALYSKDFCNIADLCYAQLLFWFSEFAINTKVIKSSSLGTSFVKSDLVLEYCKYFKAATYISGKLGSQYLDENKFEENSISIIYQDYLHPQYSQLWGDFMPYMSILDLWMNYNTEDCIRIIIGNE